MRLLADTGLSIGWTEGVAADRIGVDDFGTNTGALTDWAGRVGAVSWVGVVGEDCGRTLPVEDEKNDGKF